MTKYCTGCFLPEDKGQQQFNGLAVCPVCQAEEMNQKINMEEREQRLRDILDPYRNGNANYYNCLIHVDGSMSNLFHLHVLTKIYGMRPLGVTFNHNRYTRRAQEFIWKALEVFDIDHVVFNPRVSVQEKLSEMAKTNKNVPLFDITGIKAFSLQAAVKYGVPLVIMSTGRNEIHDGEVTDLSKNIEYYSNLVKKYCLSNAVGNELSLYDLCPYTFPSEEEIRDGRIVLLDLDRFLSGAEKSREEYLMRNYNWSDIWIGSGDYVTGKPEEAKRRNRERVLTKYEGLAKESQYGKPVYHEKLRYCVRCCMPETAEGLAYDEMGICQPCRSSEQKMHINWLERQKQFRAILKKFSSKDATYYDCIVPVSGGKDSTFQIYILTKVYGAKPLAVTFSHNWYSETGKFNLRNAIDVFDIDHIMFTPRRSVVNKLAKKSLAAIGDSCWHCHAGVGSFPLHIAVKFGIPLLVWGEPSGDNHGTATYEDPIPFTRTHFINVSARIFPEDLVDEDISLFDVNPYILPTEEEFDRTGIVGIYVGDFHFWDDEGQTEFVRDNFGWREDNVEGTYKGYKSVECIMPGVHDYTKFIKRGFGRGTDHASIDVRAGLLLREEGFELAKRYDTERPEALDYYLSITGYTESELEDILKRQRTGRAKDLL